MSPSDLDPMLLTRAHPKPEIQDAFDDWQRDKHLPDLMRAPGATMVVYARNVLDGLPEAYINSPGNRALVAELDDDLRRVLMQQQLLERLEDSMGWERRLPYVKRDVYEHAAHARSTR